MLGGVYVGCDVWVVLYVMRSCVLHDCYITLHTFLSHALPHVLRFPVNVFPLALEFLSHKGWQQERMENFVLNTQTPTLGVRFIILNIFGLYF